MVTSVSGRLERGFDSILRSRTFRLLNRSATAWVPKNARELIKFFWEGKKEMSGSISTGDAADHLSVVDVELRSSNPNSTSSDPKVDIAAAAKRNARRGRPGGHWFKSEKRKLEGDLRPHAPHARRLELGDAPAGPQRRLVLQDQRVALQHG